MFQKVRDNPKPYKLYIKPGAYHRLLIKHKEECFIRYPNTEKWVEETRRSRVFLTNFEVSGYLWNTLSRHISMPGYLWKHENIYETLFRVFEIASQSINNSVGEIQSKSSQNLLIIRNTYPNFLYGSDCFYFILMNYSWIWENSYQQFTKMNRSLLCQIWWQEIKNSQPITRTSKKDKNINDVTCLQSTTHALVHSPRELKIHPLLSCEFRCPTHYNSGQNNFCGLLFSGMLLCFIRLLYHILLLFPRRF